MRFEELFRVLKATKLPVAYHHFEEGHSPSPPFMVYLVTDSDNLGAITGLITKGSTSRLSFTRQRKI